MQELKAEKKAAREKALHEAVDGGQEHNEEAIDEEAIDDDNDEEAGQDSSKEVMVGGVSVDGSPTEMEEQEAVEVNVDKVVSEIAVEKKEAVMTKAAKNGRQVFWTAARMSLRKKK